MTLLRFLIYMLACWLGGVWVALAADAASHASWGVAIPLAIATIALAVAIAAVLWRDVEARRVVTVRMRRGGK